MTVLALGIIGGGGWAGWHLSRAEPASAAEDPNPDLDALVEPKLSSLRAGDALAPKRQKDPVDISLMTKLPDGSYIPNLNGVREPGLWTGRPFSPIVGIRRNDQGVDWWVHENGMQSTITYVDGTRNGVPVREVAMQVAFPLEKTYGADPQRAGKQK